MSYSININGHKNTSDAEESAAFEQETLDKTREFVTGLEGVQTAQFSGGHLGFIDLLATEAAKTEPSAASEPSPRASERS